MNHNIWYHILLFLIIFFQETKLTVTYLIVDELLLKEIHKNVNVHCKLIDSPPPFTLITNYNFRKSNLILRTIMLSEISHSYVR